MTTLVTLTAHAQDKRDIIEYYESLGMNLESQTKIDRDTFSLTFSGDRDLSAAILEHNPNAIGSLEFEDGTVSPLYIRRGPRPD